MNIERMQRAQSRILAEPEHFEMSHWVTFINTVFVHPVYSAGEIPQDVPTPTACNTAHCIAGDVLLDEGYKMKVQMPLFAPSAAKVIFTDRSGNAVFIEKEARDLLGLTAGQGERLFYERRWPAQFMARAGESSRQRAQRAVDRIQFMIDTGM